uniref:Uncharacterized protein n=1 Tax=Rhizophagus irregularis (strain DAOM 181602 / DAOM 197198 / MUCL 43194) TaxID=747089 RepID=U9SXB1_RHIID
MTNDRSNYHEKNLDCRLNTWDSVATVDRYSYGGLDLIFERVRLTSLEKETLHDFVGL